MTTSTPRLVVAYGVVPAHALLRAEAARFHDVAAERVVLAHECSRCGSVEHGQPYLVATAAIRDPAFVSLARAGDFSVVAITDAGRVGVDVEAEGAADFAGFAEVALHPHERESTSTDATRSWVRKEALLKAYGLGLAVDPSDLGLDGTGVAAWDSHHRQPPGPVWLRDLSVLGHVAAVAILPGDDQDVTGMSPTMRPVTT